jgi:hypothetical protein
LKTRTTISLVGSVLVLVVSPPSGPQAQQWLEDGRTCFCLRHEQNQIIRNCIGVKAKQDAYATAICQGSEAGDRPMTLTVQPPWEPVQDGTAGCLPCRPAPRLTKELPRGETR